LKRNGKAIRITTDHKPLQAIEKTRIRGLGGGVSGGRINGQLGVARAFGNYDLQPFLSIEPDIFEIDITESDEFLIMACDGVWDALSDEKAIELVSTYSKDPFKCAEKLVKQAIEDGSSDNASSIVIFL